jgi:DNA ligase (NAD+)
MPDKSDFCRPVDFSAPVFASTPKNAFNAVMPASPAQRIKHLRKELERHNTLYFLDNAPEISDQEYDALMKELVELEKSHPDLASPDSPSQRVGGTPLEGFKTVAHLVAMMSIDNTYDEAEVRAFDERTRKALGAQPRYVLEEKVDGVAVNLRYEKGLLVLAATRGDGKRGDDITTNAKTIHDIPLRLREQSQMPPLMEVRGEIFMFNSDFAKMNDKREEAGEETFANPRNATAGTLKQLDSKMVAQRRLHFMSHGVGQIENIPVDCYWDWLAFAGKLNLPTSQHAKRAENVDEVIREIEAFAKARHTLAYQTDGMVVKVDDFAQRAALGERSKAPRWVIAFKYQPDQVETTLEDVLWTVGKLGTLTPTACLAPVFVSGTTVRRATLHNIEQIERLDVRIGDRVIVEKAGEIIPQVVRAIPEKRPHGAKKIVPPAKCPSCSSPTEKPADSPYTTCINPACPAQLQARLRSFVGRNQMNIDRLGEVLIDQLVEHGLVKTFADLYRLKKEDVSSLERMAEKSAQNVIDSIAAARDRSLDRLLAGIGIRHVGNRVAVVLAQHFGSLDALAAASVEDLSSIHEIGDVIAKGVHDFFHSEAGRETIKQLKSVGVDPRMEKPSQSGPTPLAGQTVVVTGTLKHYSRTEIEELITKLGGRASGSVSKKTSFVVAGEEAGSKLDKANELGVKILSEEQFRNRIAAI